MGQHGTSEFSRVVIHLLRFIGDTFPLSSPIEQVPLLSEPLPKDREHAAATERSLRRPEARAAIGSGELQLGPRDVLPCDVGI